MPVQLRLALSGAQRAGPEFQFLDQHAPVRPPVQIQREARIGDPVPPPGGLGQILERPLAGDRRHDIAVLRRHRPEQRLTRGRLGELRQLHLGRGQVQHRLQHGNVNHLALSGGVALHQGGGDGAIGEGSGQDIGGIDAATVRPLAPLLIGQMRQIVAGGGMNRWRIGRQLRRRSGLPITGNGAIDQFRIDFGQCCIAKSEAGHHARSEILHQHVDVRHQPADDLHRARVLQIQHQTALAGVQLAIGRAGAVPQWRPMPGQLALGGFHLDHIRPRVGQQPGAIRSGDGGGKVEHAQIGEGTGHLGLSLLVLGLPACCCRPAREASRNARGSVVRSRFAKSGFCL